MMPGCTTFGSGKSRGADDDEELLLDCDDELELDEELLLGCVDVLGFDEGLMGGSDLTSLSFVSFSAVK